MPCECNARGGLQKASWLFQLIASLSWVVSVFIYNSWSVARKEIAILLNDSLPVNDINDVTSIAFLGRWETGSNWPPRCRGP